MDLFSLLLSSNLIDVWTIKIYIPLSDFVHINMKSYYWITATWTPSQWSEYGRNLRKSADSFEIFRFISILYMSSAK